MKISYCALGTGSFKIFVDDKGRYGEFYLNLEPSGSPFGEGSIGYKDTSYAGALLHALADELTGRNDDVENEKVNIVGLLEGGKASVCEIAE